uniref:EGF-like domain-containing protein n=1 Tax=Strongyloides papillosus TaxID=174720 RepID=A0A0N5C475_STREA
MYFILQWIEITPLYIDRVAFVNPQSKCRIRCLNGGVCAYKIKSPREHICICMEGYYEGAFCEKDIRSSISSQNQPSIPSTTTSPSTSTIVHEYTINGEEEWRKSGEDESFEESEWDANETVAEDTDKHENEVNYSQQQHQSYDNNDITRHPQEDGTFNDNTSFDNDNENKQDEVNHNEEEEEDNDTEEGNLPYFDQNEDTSSTEVYELHEDSKEDRSRNVPTMETTTMNDHYTTPIHIIPKVNTIKTTPGPINYYLHANDDNNDNDDDGWMMVKKRNYAIRITNSSPNNDYSINGIAKSLIFTSFYIIFTRYL